MTCPFCDQEMRFGHATIKETILSFLVFGLSYQNLYFTPGEKPGRRIDDELVLESGNICNAWNCDACEITLLDRKGRSRPETKVRAENWWAKYH